MKNEITTGSGPLPGLGRELGEKRCGLDPDETRRPILTDLCSIQDLLEEIDWLQGTLVEVLDQEVCSGPTVDPGHPWMAWLPSCIVHSRITQDSL